MAFGVLIVDPQPFFCQTLAASFAQASDFEVAGWTTDELEAVDLANRHRPDLVLTEVALRAGSGLNLIKRLRDSSRVVLLTRQSEGDVLLDAAAAGAMGCLGHDLRPTVLFDLLRRAAGGLFAVDDTNLQQILMRASTRAREAPDGGPGLSVLSAREREVVQLLAQGLDDEAIGRALYLSAHTVRTHVGNIMRKLGVHSRHEAARVVMRAGWIEQPTRRMAVFRIRGPDLGVG